MYLKCIDSSGNVSVKLVTVKSKVAPLKLLTILRLELTAALLLAQLVEKVKSALNLTISKTILWTDSTIVLNWLNISTHNLQVFVADRDTSILEITSPEDWRHVPTDYNPADCISRGVSPSQVRSGRDNTRRFICG